MVVRSDDVTLGTRHFLSAALTARGYRDNAVLGPFDSPRGPEFAVTIHARRGEPTRTMRGTFEDLRAAIDALPRRE
jgi:hypothetical protein